MIVVQVSAHKLKMSFENVTIQLCLHLHVNIFYDSENSVHLGMQYDLYTTNVNHNQTKLTEDNMKHISNLLNIRKHLGALRYPIVEE